jgi:hypothetical protein
MTMMKTIKSKKSKLIAKNNKMKSKNRGHRPGMHLLTFLKMMRLLSQMLSKSSSTKKTLPKIRRFLLLVLEPLVIRIQLLSRTQACQIT